MINGLERGYMRRKHGNNPVGTHVYHECLEGHRTLKRRDDQNYKCQRCLQLRFEAKQKFNENNELLPLKDLDKLI